VSEPIEPHSNQPSIVDVPDSADLLPRWKTLADWSVPRHGATVDHGQAADRWTRSCA